MSATTEPEASETPRNTEEPQQARGRTAAEELAALPAEVRENPHGRSAANPPCRRYGPYFGTEGGDACDHVHGLVHKKCWRCIRGKAACEVIDGGMKDKWGVLWNALRHYAHQLRTVDDTEDDRVRDAREAYDTALADFQTVLPRWKHQANARVGNNTPSKRQRVGVGVPAGLATNTLMLEEMQRQTQAQTAIAMGIRSFLDRRNIDVSDIDAVLGSLRPGYDAEQDLEEAEEEGGEEESPAPGPSTKRRRVAPVPTAASSRSSRFGQQ